MTIETSHVVSIYPHQVDFKGNHNQYVVIVLRCWKWGFDCHRFLVRILFQHGILPDHMVLPTRTPMTDKSLRVLVFWVVVFFLL